MIFDVSHFALLAALAAWISSLSAALVWPRRDEAPGGRALSWLLISAALWSVGAAIELTVTGLEAKILWSQIQYLGTLSAPPLFALFAAEFARSNWFAGPRRVAALFVVPALTLGLAWTNPFHGLVWSGFQPSDEMLNLLIYERGPWFWVGVVGYSYLCLAAGAWQLALAALRLPRALRRQAITLLVAIAIPWLANASYIFGYFLRPGLDPTPLSIAAMGVVCGFAIFRYGLVDLIPRAQAAVAREMSDGLIVFDDQDRVIEVNRAARTLLGRAVPAIGQSFAEALAPWPLLAHLPREGQRLRLELPAEAEGTPAIEAEISYLAGEPGASGTLLLLRDVTERLRFERDLLEANRRLQQQLEENQALQEQLRDQAVRDPLTGLFNRRYADETLPRELSRAERVGEPLALVMLDLDHFKALNDRFGHAAGDQLLRELGLLLRAKTRRADIACRFGGEEFLVAMPGTDAPSAAGRAEDLRESFAELAGAQGRGGLLCTLSAGVAAFPEHASSLEALLAGADLALYAAKAAGRNRVFTAA